jgi:hypothetical protein
MTQHNYIRKRFHDDVAFAEFDRNPNFIPDDILPDIVARSRSHGKILLTKHIKLLFVQPQFQPQF